MSDPVKPGADRRATETAAKKAEPEHSGSRRRPSTGVSVLPAQAPLPEPSGGVPRPAANKRTSEISGAVPRAAASLDPAMPAPNKRTGDISGPNKRTGDISGPNKRTGDVSAPNKRTGDVPANRRTGDVPTRNTTQSVRAVQNKKAPVGLIAGGLVAALVAIALVNAVRGRAPFTVAPRAIGVVEAWGGDVGEPGMTNYIRRVAQDVGSHVRGCGDVDVVVTLDPQPHAVPLPGKQILISAGLLRRLNTEGQLAGVLAHLIVHIATGVVDQTFLSHGGDQITAAVAAGTRVHTEAEEASLATATRAALDASGYSARGLVEAFDVLGWRQPGPPKPEAPRLPPTSFVQQHQIAAATLTEWRALEGATRGVSPDYGRLVLDKIGRTAATVAENKPPPPLPPPPKKPDRPIPRPKKPPPGAAVVDAGPVTVPAPAPR